MKPETLSIVVARAIIAGEPKIDIVAPAEVRAKVHQPIQVKFSYRLEETSTEREEWTFTLKSQVGPKSPPGVTARWKDRRVLADDLWGTLMQEFAFDAPGRYEGGFEVEAHYAQSDWTTKKPGAKAERRGQGRFSLIVER